MQPASGSEFYPARDARTPLTRGFLLGHRHRTQEANEQRPPHPSFLNPHNPLCSRGTSSSNSRRKRSTESVLFLTEQDGGRKENKRIRTSSCSCYQQLIHSSVPQNETTTSHSDLTSTSPRASDLDSVALRVKVRQFSATARSATGACTASTSAFVPACCSNNKSLSAHNKSRSTSVFKPLSVHSTNVASPFEDKSGGSSSSAAAVPSRNRSRINLPAVRSGKAKGSETNNSDTASPSPPPPSSSPPPAPFPSIFDVDRADLTPGTLTCTTTAYRTRLDSFFDSSSPSFQFPSFDALDDLTRWGMDAMTFLSTSDSDASNIDQTTATNSDPNSTFSNPFSTPFGDDDFLENEIPFPSTRPRVVLEPMGVKKSKTLAADKARTLTASSSGNSRSRYLNPFNPYDLSLPNRPSSSAPKSSPSTPKSASRPPPILPHPLPLLQSDESPSPLNDDSLARTSSYLQRIAEPSQLPSTNQDQLAEQTPSSSPNMSPSSNPRPLPSDTESENSKTSFSGNLRRKLAPLFSPLRKDLEDRRRLEDFQLSVMFPQTAHYEVWDMSDYGWVSVPALLCLMMKDPKRWATTPLSTPDVSLIELKCDDMPLPVRFASLCPERQVIPAISPSSRPISPSISCRPNTYSTTFLGGKSAMDESSFPQNGISRKRGMSLMDALKKNEVEQKMAKDKISLEGKWTSTFGLPGVVGCDIERKQGGLSPGGGGKSASSPRGWYLKFWIPIPTRLFLKRETRMFTIHAQIWMVDQMMVEGKPDRFETELQSEWSRENDGVPSLEAETEMTVSHLRKERDMDRWWW